MAAAAAGKRAARLLASAGDTARDPESAAGSHRPAGAEGGRRPRGRGTGREGAPSGRQTSEGRTAAREKRADSESTIFKILKITKL